MKTKGRFIAILAVLSLLIAILPIGPAGAATGVVALDKTYYSDKTGFNIVTISVTDSDLSAGRVGTARFAVPSGSTAPAGTGVIPFLLTGATVTGVGSAVLSGELAKTDTKNGDGTTVAFTLSKLPRDKDDDGIYEDADVVAVVGGTTLTPTTDYTVAFATGIVTFATAPATGTGTVVLTYEYSEYNQTSPVGTPLRLFGTSVKYGTTLALASNEVSIAAINNTASSITTTIDVLALQVIVITFVYDVTDTATNIVTVSSNTSVAGGKNRQVNGAETSASSGIFESKVALFNGGDLGKIESESTDSANDTGAGVTTNVTGVQVGELNNTLGLDLTGSALTTRVGAAATAVGLTADSLASDLLKQLVPVADGDTLTASYVDSSPSSTIAKTATVDLAAPTVTLQTPTDKLFSNDQLLSLVVDVIDTGAGLTQADLQTGTTGGSADGGIVVTAGVSGTQIEQPILNGFKVSFAPASIMAEGNKDWLIRVTDKVGNVPVLDTTTASKSPRGSAPPASILTTTGVNPFRFTVDITGPTVTSATTGLYLKNPGITTGTTVESQSSDNRAWVRLFFTLGTGTAPIDPATVATSDFRVAGVEPISVRVNTVAHESGAVAVGTAVYLEVAQQDTDARPKVELVGEIRDKANNARTSGTITSASDNLSPVLTVTTSAALGEKDVTVTVVSSESLVVNPTISVATTAPSIGTVRATGTHTGAANAAVLTDAAADFITTSLVATGDTVKNTTDGSSVTITGVTATTITGVLTGGTDNDWDVGDAYSIVDATLPTPLTAQTVTSTGTKSWTAKYSNPALAASKQWVVVTATDVPGNAATVGDDSPSGELFTFQVDDAAPTVAFKDAGTAALATTNQQEGAVWVVSVFDEDEYTGDTYKTVTVTAMTLKVKDGAVITSALTDLFTSDSISYTLAVNLTPGTYNISITGVDSAGNTVTAATDFKVVARVPFSLALKPGVNLASIPGTPVGDAGNLNVLLDGLPVTAVVTYSRALDIAGENPWLTSTKDAETGLFTGDISVLEPGKAYFITATASTTAKLLIEQPSMVLPPTIQVKQGFNALGFWSISGATTADIDDYLNSIKWTVAYTFDPTPGIGWTVIRPDNPAAIDTQAASGTGYLIFVTEDGTLTP